MKGSCNPRGTRTLARGRHARIFEERYVDDSGGSDRVAYGCLLGRQRRYFLAFAEDPVYIGNFGLAGHFAGLSRSYCPADCGTGIAVVDLTTGLARYNRDASPQLDMDSDEVTDLVLAGSGGVAWITCESLCEVDELDDDAPVPLDAGAGIKRSSLTLAGPTLSWRSNGMTKTAQLR